MKQILDFVRDFAKVRRWSQTHCAREESSLEHTAAVALIALKISDECTYEVNVARLLAKALLHDMEETITGDIMTPVKYHDPEITKAIKEYECEAAADVAENVFGEWSYGFWLNAKDDTVEGHIIRIADKASVVYKFRQEILLGNAGFAQYEENIWNALHEIKIHSKFPELNPLIDQLMDYLQEK